MDRSLPEALKSSPMTVQERWFSNLFFLGGERQTHATALGESLPANLLQGFLVFAVLLLELRWVLFPHVGYPADLLSNERKRSPADSWYFQQLLVREGGNYTHSLDATLS